MASQRRRSRPSFHRRWSCSKSRSTIGSLSLALMISCVWMVQSLIPASSRNSRGLWVPLLLLVLPPWKLYYCSANVAYPGIWTGRQPNGQATGTEQLLIGVPEYHYAVVETDASFYPTVRSHDGSIQFASLGSDGRYIPTNVAVGAIDPDRSPLEDALLERRHVVHAQCMEQDYCKWKQKQRQTSLQQRPLVTSGTILNLVIPFQFSNHKDSRPPIPIDDLDELLFNGDLWTVKDYFLKQSYGKLTVETEFLQYVTIPYSEQECANHQSGLSVAIHTCLHAVLEEAAKTIDNFYIRTLASATTVTFVHSGYAAEFAGNDSAGAWFEDRIWSHAWELSSLPNGQTKSLKYALISDKYDRKNAHVNRVGAAVHEIAQVLGAPLMYGEYPGYGLGYYDMLANPWGFDGTLTHCASMSPYTKMLFGWVDIVEIEQDGVYELEHSVESNKVYKIQRGFPDGEYLLLENRQEEEYDDGLTQPGIAIYHIDEQANDVGGYPGSRHFPKDHYKVALIQGDGRYDLERMKDEGDSGDLFQSGRFTGVGPDGVFLPDGSLAGRGGYPNTNSYQGGVERPSGVTISDIGVPDVVMSFRVSFG